MRGVKTISVLLGIFVSIAVIQVGYEISHQLIFGKASYSSEAVFKVPNTNVEIILERRVIHLFLAEYERAIILRIGGNEIFHQKAAADSGGYSQMNVYQISPTEFLLSGASDNYELDVAERKINSDVSMKKLTNVKFTGVFDADEKHVWRFIRADEREEKRNGLKK